MLLSLIFRPRQHSGKNGMTLKFGMETRIHSEKCCASREACRLSLTHRWGSSFLNQGIVLFLQKHPTINNSFLFFCRFVISVRCTIYNSLFPSPQNLWLRLNYESGDYSVIDVIIVISQVSCLTQISVELYGTFLDWKREHSCKILNCPEYHSFYQMLLLQVNFMSAQMLAAAASKSTGAGE